MGSAVMAPWNYPFMLRVRAGDRCDCGRQPGGSSRAPCAGDLCCDCRAAFDAAFPPHFVAAVEGGRAENTKLLEQKFDFIFLPE